MGRIFACFGIDGGHGWYPVPSYRHNHLAANTTSTAAFHHHPLQGTGIAAFEEMTRDTHTFKRRVGDLPTQKEADGAWDFRGLLHRDGTVFSVVNAEELKQPEVGGAVWVGVDVVCCCMDVGVWCIILYGCWRGCTYGMYCMWVDAPPHSTHVIVVIY